MMARVSVERSRAARDHLGAVAVRQIPVASGVTEGPVARPERQIAPRCRERVQDRQNPTYSRRFSRQRL